MPKVTLKGQLLNTSGKLANETDYDAALKAPGQAA